MSFPRYPEYKSSESEWLGDVPTTWLLSPLKNLTSFVNGYVFKPDSWSESGTPIIRIENLNGGETFNYFDGEVDKRHHVNTGDLLFGWSGNRGTSFGPFIWKRDGKYFLNQHIFKLAELRCCKQWFYWCLKAVTAHVEDQAQGIIGMVHVTKGDLGAIKVAVPSKEEQTAIAAFLDRETAKIDALVAEQERLIALLKEKRQAVISHAVTKGLNPDAPMKPSGIEWLGDVPAHWEVLRLKNVAISIEQGWSPQCEGFPSEGDEWAVLKVGCVNGGRFERYENKVLPPDLEPLPELALTAGDLLISRANTRDLVGSAAVVPNDEPRLLLCDKLYRIRFNEDRVLPAFVAHWLATPEARGQIELDATGASASMVNIGQATILEMPLSCPPVNEQVEIVRSIDDQCSRLDGTIKSASDGITLLKERRSALISAAVTGQIDVRGLAKEPCT